MKNMFQKINEFIEPIFEKNSRNDTVIKKFRLRKNPELRLTLFYVKISCGTL